MKFSAIIPVRAGSRRLPNKNILPFGNSNLLVHKINQLKMVEKIDEIVVSSDSEIMLEMALNENVKIHRRSIEYSDEVTKSFGEVVALLAEQATKAENVIWSPVVCPLCDEECFTEAINDYIDLVLKKREYDSLISAKKFKQYLWDEKGPVNYKLGLGHVPSQKLPEWKTIVNGYYIAPREKMIEWIYFFGKKPYCKLITAIQAIDIDDQIDYDFCKFIWDKTHHK